MRRARIDILGAVQGVGFRPFVYRIARELHLHGWVINSPQGVSIEVEGTSDILDAFLLRIGKEKPSRSFIQSMEVSILDPVGLDQFEIRQSEIRGEITTLVLPDIATCPDCLEDTFDPANRRYLYPFTNCTNCGPRFSIIEALPYDRPNTTMKQFIMCDACQGEYEDPNDRRFHAQPNACPVCGPHVELWDTSGKIISANHAAIMGARDAVRSGRILAVKGIGGFHLIVDAHNDSAVQRLRIRKHREEKPLALMFPSLESIRTECVVSPLEERLLRSPESPIVLLAKQSTRRNGDRTIAESVAPGNPYLGVMLPYSPLHHILLRKLGTSLVATSGNLSDEPICTDEREAVARLYEIADLFLVHNRPIKRHVDDSIVRAVAGRAMVIRRARGYAPLPIHVDESSEDIPVLAVGAHLKNTVALAKSNNIFVSQHIGDLETAEASNAFEHVIKSFKTLYNAKPSVIIADLHPEYLSTKYAQSQGGSVEYVQHHYAHVASCMAENQLEGNVLGVSWDGTGFGPDGTIWGGEFLHTNATSFERIATFRRFPLPGGDRAIKEPRRTAVGLLYEMCGNALFEREDIPLLHRFTRQEVSVIQQMLEKQINSPVTSSAGRLFDAVGAIIGLRERVSFEGQAAMEMEFLSGPQTNEAYPFSTSGFDSSANDSSPGIIDWAPMISQILDDNANDMSRSLISTKFHNTLVEIIVDVARRVGEERIVLTGGCFQNKYLLERSIQQLETAGFRTYWHQRVPPNDGGIALGQVYAYWRSHRKNVPHPETAQLIGSA
ncbi:MAG TPA: carbamoyltransferase HypF [Bacteroidota bacterium]